jgi:hypothetical protein
MLVCFGRVPKVSNPREALIATDLSHSHHFEASELLLVCWQGAERDGFVLQME